MIFSAQPDNLARGSLTPPPLPHHRACGSVHGGSVLIGLVDTRKGKPSAARAALWNTRGQGGAVAEPPGTMWAAGGLCRQVPADAAASQFTNRVQPRFQECVVSREKDSPEYNRKKKARVVTLA
jgi:hypothetical protein